MAGEKEYKVITKKGIDIAEIEAELERDTTSDAAVSANVPNRTVDVAYAKKANDRITHYMMTDAEAAELSKDPRIHAVETKPDPEVFNYELFETQTAQFDRSTSNDADAKNWGLYRHMIKEFDPASTSNTYSADYTYTLDGTGVDVVIQDDGIDPTGHPEWEDANGTTRFQQIDWYTESGVAGAMPAGHYTANPAGAGEHGSHCAGIAAGKTFGWAKNAKIYSLRHFGGAGNEIPTTDKYDLIRHWHTQKPIDPNTGFKRPTIVNQSWGWRASFSSTLQVTHIFFKGVDQGIAQQDLMGGGLEQYGIVYYKIPYQSASDDVEQEQLTDSGVICVKSAGNGYHPIAGANAPYYSGIHDSFMRYIGDLGVDYYYNRPGSPHSDDTIYVASLDRTLFGTEEFITQSSERGPRIDIITGGDDITSATSTVSTYAKQFYPGSGSHYTSRISGTSMAAPQITGMGALWLQANPGGTAQQFKDFLAIHATSNSYDSGTDESFNEDNVIPRRYGAPNRIAYWPYNSPNPWGWNGSSGSGTAGINT